MRNIWQKLWILSVATILLLACNLSSAPSTPPPFTPDIINWKFTLKAISNSVVSEIDTSTYWQPKPEYLQISPDGKHIAFASQEGDKKYIVVDDSKGKLYDYVTAPTFSPDNKHVVYAARIDKKYLVVLDGVGGKEYDDLGTPLFSPNSQRLAYAAKDGEKWLLVVDGKESERYDTVFDPVFSPDSKSIACAVGLGKNQMVLLNNKPLDAFDFIG